MGNLAVMYQTAVEACQRTNPPCLYSMDCDVLGMNGFVRRMGGTWTYDEWLGSSGTNPWQYFDCSGFVAYCLWKGGYSEKNLGFTTVGEYDILKQMGFKIYAYTAGMPLRNGDIVWYNKGSGEGANGHTEIVYNASTRQTMGARGRGTPWGQAPTIDKNNQVRILSGNTDSVYSWQYLARDESQGTVELKWVNKDDYLSDDEMKNNISIAVSVLSQQGYSSEAISGIVGNMCAESTMSPILNEKGGGGGYGLVQWTPKSDLVNAVAKYSLGDYTNGTVQCKVLAYEGGWLGENAQWYDIYPHKPPVPFTNYETWAKRKDYSPEDMAYAFMSYYERPAWETCHLDRRQIYARQVYTWISDGMFNGNYAYNEGNKTDLSRTVLLIDYIRRKNSLRNV